MILGDKRDVRHLQLILTLFLSAFCPCVLMYNVKYVHKISITVQIEKNKRLGSNKPVNEKVQHAMTAVLQEHASYYFPYLGQSSCFRVANINTCCSTQILLQNARE